MSVFLTGLALGKVISTNDISCVLGEGCVKGNEIGLGEKLIEGNWFNTSSTSSRGRHDRIVTHHLHTERLGPFCHLYKQSCHIQQRQRYGELIYDNLVPTKT